MPGEIEDLLREYAAYSRGKIQVIVKDPIKAKIAEQVEQLGVMPQQIQTMEQDESGLITVYTGVVIEYIDQSAVLPVVFSLSSLEYDLTSRIRSLVHERERQIGIIVGDNPQAWNELYGYMANSLSFAGYQIRLIAPGMDIPDSLPILAVLDGVETLDEAALYQIDRYIQMGGKVLFTVKGVNVDWQTSMEATLVNDLGLLEMLDTYGVRVLPELAMDRSSLNMQYQTRSPYGAMQIRILRNAQWVRVLAENANREHPVGANFSGLDLYWPSPLELLAPPSVQALPLFTSTAQAWSMREPFYTSPDTGYLFEKDAAATRGQKILGASLAGEFPSWFRGKPKPSPSTPGTELPDLPEATKPARIIVVGNTVFATALMGQTGAQHNLDFLLQAADWLGNDDDIIGIRNRQAQTGRLDRLIDPAKKAAAMNFAQVLNVAIMPLLVVAAAVIIGLRRKAKSLARSGQAENSEGNKE
jgi:ABC-type uncharacterized transport system involved in gliding motility auxiliary subunit